ncbi:MAG TPA: 16S rRNA (cytosine(1402)-N(4))-methyltransferase RsmH [Deltaproteobacteria bacterium]|nr:16S rRNA (cytosine(1402)-N(4))-methyltransferase RsmH [Deltaproteobacteria bacterium]
MPYRHIPVMQREVLQYLNCRPGKIYVDGTLGGAGHARSILEKTSPRGLLVAIDQDIEAIENAEESLKAFKTRIHLFHGNFIQLPDALSQFGIDGVDGILLDLGLSLHQIKASGRGFSFQLDEPLDMRMNIETKETAADIIKYAPEQVLRKIFKSYGEERWSGRIAKKIAAERSREAIVTSKKLAEIVMAAIPRGAVQRQRIHPATRVFMALRIAVNKELERLEAFMDVAINLLNPSGRLCVISYHSLEDRIVKHRIRALEKGCQCPGDFPQCVCGLKSQVKNLTRKAIGPTALEIEDNPMARSARLRAAEKR